jgi:hypothetical protein
MAPLSALPIREQVIDVLSQGPSTKAKLREIFKESGYTEQGFYKALNQLHDEEVVTIHKESVSLSFLWIQNEFDRMSKIAAAYQAPVYQTYFGSLKEGTRVTYKFKTLHDLYIFWVHAIFVAMKGMPGRSYLISLSPHDWFQRMRPDINQSWKAVTLDHPHWIILTHATGDEMRKTKYAELKLLERMAGENPLKQKESFYINVAGDLVFETKLDERMVVEIQKFMADDSMPPEALLERPGTFSISIERSPKKAKRIENKVKKYFTVPLH